MGAGFILEAFMEVKHKVSPSIPRSYGSAAMTAIEALSLWGRVHALNESVVYENTCS